MGKGIVALMAALAAVLVPSPSHAAVVGGHGYSMTASAGSSCTLNGWTDGGGSKNVKDDGKTSSVSFKDSGTFVSTGDPAGKLKVSANFTQKMTVTKAAGGFKSAVFATSGKLALDAGGSFLNYVACQGSGVTLSNGSGFNMSIPKKGTLTIAMSSPGQGYKQAAVYVSSTSGTVVNQALLTSTSSVSKFKVKPGMLSASINSMAQVAAEAEAPFDASSVSLGLNVTITFKGA